MGYLLVSRYNTASDDCVARCICPAIVLIDFVLGAVAQTAPLSSNGKLLVLVFELHLSAHTDNVPNPNRFDGLHVPRPQIALADH